MYHYYVFEWNKKCVFALESNEKKNDCEKQRYNCKIRNEKKNENKNEWIVYTSLYSTCKSRKYIACNDILYFHFGCFEHRSYPLYIPCITFVSLANANHKLILWWIEGRWNGQQWTAEREREWAKDRTEVCKRERETEKLYRFCASFYAILYLLATIIIFVQMWKR